MREKEKKFTCAKCNKDFVEAISQLEMPKPGKSFPFKIVGMQGDAQSSENLYCSGCYDIFINDFIPWFNSLSDDDKKKITEAQSPLRDAAKQASFKAEGEINGD